jgi:hypothetical protein
MVDGMISPQAIEVAMEKAARMPPDSGVKKSFALASILATASISFMSRSTQPTRLQSDLSGEAWVGKLPTSNCHMI